MRILKMCRDGIPFMCIQYKAIVSVQRMSPTSLEVILAGAPTVTQIEMGDEEYTNCVFDDICKHMGMEDWIDGKV